MVSLVLQLMFYAALSEVILVAMTGELKLDDLLSVIDPVGKNVYWFATQYLILYVASPYINQMIATLSKEAHKRLAILLVVMWGLYPTIAFWAKNTFSLGNNIMWFITVYVAAAYFRLYDIKMSMRTSVVGYLVCAAILLLSRFVLDKAGVLLNISSDLGKFMFYNNSPVVFASSVFVFMIFKQIDAQKLPFRKAINLILWEIIRINMHANIRLPLLIAKVIIVVVGIFICGCTMKYIRRAIGNCFVCLFKKDKTRI